MRFFEFTTPTPEQNLIANLKKQKAMAADALKAEQGRQKRQKALANISKNNQVLAKLNN